MSSEKLAQHALNEFEKIHNPFYPNEMRWDRTSLLHLCLYAVKAGEQSQHSPEGTETLTANEIILKALDGDNIENVRRKNKVLLTMLGEATQALQSKQGYDTLMQRCPKCEGQDRVSKPPYVPQGIDSWVSSGAIDYLCDVCNGNKIIPIQSKQGWSDEDMRVCRNEFANISGTTMADFEQWLTQYKAEKGIV